ncbi:MAG: 2-polyprenyl-6-hydroxyphenyl methylase/3-demethylubiquinone-9 3-methyltransferase [Rickettsiales bacterium]|jgi:2-polyprenyl-6-hydroxyphenyl methylase/3-demethylubiquinone-9 3-methyltransferase
MVDSKKKLSTIIPEEVEKFSAIASEWWDKNGKFKPLHKINPVRVVFIRDLACKYFRDLNSESRQPLKNIKILDIGCGGGLVSESMSKLGADVVGLDPSFKNIQIAKSHAEQSNLDIEYVNSTIEEFSEENKGVFDIILNLEAVEHVDYPDQFIKFSSLCLRDGGIAYISTINRNAKSFLMAIVGAEYILRWLPVGTHDWKKFFKPSEIVEFAENSNLKFLESKGFNLNILKNQWSLSDNLDVNYISAFQK